MLPEVAQRVAKAEGVDSAPEGDQKTAACGAVHRTAVACDVDQPCCWNPTLPCHLNHVSREIDIVHVLLECRDVKQSHVDLKVIVAPAARCVHNLAQPCRAIKADPNVLAIQLLLEEFNLGSLNLWNEALEMG